MRRSATVRWLSGNWRAAPRGSGPAHMLVCYISVYICAAVLTHTHTQIHTYRLCMYTYIHTNIPAIFHGRLPLGCDTHITRAHTLDRVVVRGTRQMLVRVAHRPVPRLQKRRNRLQLIRVRVRIMMARRRRPSWRSWRRSIRRNFPGIFLCDSRHITWTGRLAAKRVLHCVVICLGPVKRKL